MNKDSITIINDQWRWWSIYKRQQDTNKIIHAIKQWYFLLEVSKFIFIQSLLMLLTIVIHRITNFKNNWWIYRLIQFYSHLSIFSSLCLNMIYSFDKINTYFSTFYVLLNLVISTFFLSLLFVLYIIYLWTFIHMLYLCIFIISMIFILIIESISFYVLFLLINFQRKDDPNFYSRKNFLNIQCRYSMYSLYLIFHLLKLINLLKITCLIYGMMFTFSSIFLIFLNLYYTLFYFWFYSDRFRYRFKNIFYACYVCIFIMFELWSFLFVLCIDIIQVCLFGMLFIFIKYFIKIFIGRYFQDYQHIFFSYTHPLMIWFDKNTLHKKYTISWLKEASIIKEQGQLNINYKMVFKIFLCIALFLFILLFKAALDVTIRPILKNNFLQRYIFNSVLFNIFLLYIDIACFFIISFLKVKWQKIDQYYIALYFLIYAMYMIVMIILSVIIILLISGLISFNKNNSIVNLKFYLNLIPFFRYIKRYYISWIIFVMCLVPTILCWNLVNNQFTIIMMNTIYSIDSYSVQTILQSIKWIVLFLASSFARDMIFKRSIHM